MQKTNINYLTHTCNPLAMRCTPVSPGCANCWHLKLCDMHKLNPNLPANVRLAKEGKRGPVLIKKELESMLVRGEPKRVGVQFMGDIFHDAVSFSDIHSVMAAISLTPRHQFLVLTKRPTRMLSYFDNMYFTEDGGQEFAGERDDLGGEDCCDWNAPLPNVWLGTSCENQEWADRRIPLLEKIPAAVRWVSFEPLLEEMVVQTRGIDWAVIGCESGPGRRPCELEWVRNIVFQFKNEGKAVWVKQIEIDGKVETDVTKFPKELQVRELPK